MRSQASDPLYRLGQLNRNMASTSSPCAVRPRASRRRLRAGNRHNLVFHSHRTAGTEMADDSSPIKVEASAKIEIKTEIPSDASGRLAHAVADAVSPITELLGMAGDAVRTARIHRRIVAAKVIREAEAQLEFSGAKVHPVPLKIAVPLLEHASQEEPDDDIMIRLWAQLLASSASSEAVSPRFVSLLSEMNKRQV